MLRKICFFQFPSFLNLALNEFGHIGLKFLTHSHQKVLVSVL